MKSKKLFGLGLAALASVTVVGGTIAAQDMTSVLAGGANLQGKVCNKVISGKTLKGNFSSMSGDLSTYELGHILVDVSTNAHFDDNQMTLNDGHIVCLHRTNKPESNLYGEMQNIDTVTLKRKNTDNFTFKVTLGFEDRTRDKVVTYEAKDFFKANLEDTFTFENSTKWGDKTGANYFAFEVVSGTALMESITINSVR